LILNYKNFRGTDDTDYLKEAKGLLCMASKYNFAEASFKNASTDSDSSAVTTHFLLVGVSDEVKDEGK
jgi:hypothetical protein